MDGLKKSGLTNLVWIIVCLLLYVAGQYPPAIERVYSTGVYPCLAAGLRLLTGFLPVALGDLLYAAAVVFLLRFLVRFARALKQRAGRGRTLLLWSSRLLTCLLVTVAIFYLFWGLNYSRLGIARQLDMDTAVEKYPPEELKALAGDVVTQLNSSATRLGSLGFRQPGVQEMFGQVCRAYDTAARQHRFLQYRFPSVKKSLVGWLGKYLNFTGYYNPFTGEANVNTTVPEFMVPFIAAHEMAHQLGYATEDEANFVGYYVAQSSGNDTLRYSANFELYLYVNRELFRQDSAAARANSRLLDTLVKRDLAVYRKYLQDSRNSLERYSSFLYNGFLQANNQPRGLGTYSEVTRLLLAYRRKYGRL
jgi:hypothetical protein